VNPTLKELEAAPVRLGSQRAASTHEGAAILVVGGGPAGSVCAAFCAQAGVRVTLLERATFPREKVCGDCLNPNCWPILDRLGVSEPVLHLPHARLSTVTFVDTAGCTLDYPLPLAERGEIAVPRRAFDALLLNHARAAGATVLEQSAVTEVSRLDGAAGWKVSAGTQRHRARILVAADGRNSTVARVLGLMPPLVKDRVGLQTHFPLPSSEKSRVIMRFLADGYCGRADVGAGLANLCLVANPARIGAVKAWATAEFQLPAGQPWRTIAPLERRTITSPDPSLLLIGDTARVVEPFTGEGIYYALATGELAAQCIIENRLEEYPRLSRELYRGRLWINGLARAACKHPAVAAGLLQIARSWPSTLALLTRKVTRASCAW
jgi:flavin-dependent dehydrogenase